MAENEDCINLFMVTATNTIREIHQYLSNQNIINYASNYIDSLIEVLDSAQKEFNGN